MDKDLLKDVFLHGVTHADMARFLIDSKDIVSSYDNASVYDYVMKCEKYEKRRYVMTKWRAIYSNSKSGEICDIFVNSKSLTRGVFWSLINRMFFDACQGCENDELEALVVGGTRTYVVKMRTFTDGARIWTNVYIDGQLVRTMVVAD